MVNTMKREYYSTIKEREAIYTFLKTVFEAPLTIEILLHWKEKFTPEFIDILAVDNEELHQFLINLKNNDLKFIATNEKKAYLATFNVFNESGHIPAPPWESIHMTKDRTMFAEPVFQIRNQCKNFDLEIINKHKEPEDHIAVELEFMCYLINFTKESLQVQDENNYLKGLYTQYWLHKEHFNRWIKSFITDIKSSETSDFYKGMAKLLYLFLEEDFDYIKTIKVGLENE